MQFKNSSHIRTCKVCKGKLARLEVSIEEKQQEKVNPYSYFKAKEKSNAIKVMVGEPDILNPNSFENLSVILWSLGKRAKIAKYSPLISKAESRKWIFIENDGGILNPVLKLIFNVYCCLDCNKAIYGKKILSRIYIVALYMEIKVLSLLGLFHKQVYFILKWMLQNRLLTFLGTFHERNMHAPWLC